MNQRSPRQQASPTFGSLDAEALLCLCQHEGLESCGALCREISAGWSLQVGKHQLLQQLKAPGCPLEAGGQRGQGGSLRCPLPERI